MGTSVIRVHQSICVKMPPRRRRQKSRTVIDKKESGFADDEKADYFGDVDAEADEDTKGPDTALFSEELEKQLARKKHLEELKKVFKTGKRLEAKDHGTEVWYPAKVVEYDDLDLEVLIHFENWSQRYDEWISIDSPRLRLLPDDSVQTKTTKVFNVGDKVMATWTDSRKYPAEIKAVLPEDKYQVLFYDGFVKVLKGTRITKLEETAASTQQLPATDPATASNSKSTLEIPGLNTPQTNLEPKYSKEERRLRMRKLNIAELFHTNRRRRRRKGGNSDDSESLSDVDGKVKQKIRRNKGAHLLTSDSENSGADYRSKSRCQSRLHSNDSDTCDRVESKGMTQRTSSPIVGSDIENRSRARRMSSSAVGGSDIESKSLTRRMSSSSLLGGSDIERRTRTRRNSSSPCQGNINKSKIRRRKASSSPLVGSDIETQSVTRRMSSSALGGSDIETRTKTRRMSSSPLRGSEIETKISTQRTSPLVSGDIETGRGIQNMSLCPLEGSDIETTTSRERTSTSNVETRNRTQRTSSSPCGGSDKEMGLTTQRTSMSPNGGSDRETKSTTQRTSLSPCVDSDVGTRTNRRRKSSSLTKGRRQAQTHRLTAFCPLGGDDVEPRTQSPFGGSDISRSASRVGSEISESDIELRKTYRKCVSEGEMDNMEHSVVSKRKRKRRHRKPWGRAPKRKKITESFTDLSSYSGHSAAGSETGSALLFKGWTMTTEEEQSVTVKNISDEISTKLTTVCITSEKLPPGWSKYAVQRKPDSKDTKWNVYYVSPDGQKLLKKTDLINYKSHFPVPDFDFSFKPKDQSELIDDLNSELSNQAQFRSKLPTIQENALTEKVAPNSLKTLLPKRPKEESVPSPPLLVPDSNCPVDRTQKNLKGETAEHIVNGTLVIGNLKVLIKDSQYSCPETECQKIYWRKRSLMLHIKRSHPGCYRLTEKQNNDDESEGNTNTRATTSNFEETTNDKLNSKEGVERATDSKETVEKKETGTRNSGLDFGFLKSDTIVEEEEEEGEAEMEERKDDIEEDKEKASEKKEKEDEKFVQQEQTHLPAQEPSPLPLEDPPQLLQEPTELSLPEPNQLPCQQEAIQQPEIVQELVQNAELEPDNKPELEEDIDTELSQNTETDLSQTQDEESGQEMDVDPDHASESGAESDSDTLQPSELETGKELGDRQMCEAERSWDTEQEDANESEPEPISEPELEMELDPNNGTDSGTTVHDDLSGSAHGDSSQDGVNIDKPTLKTLLPVIRLQKLEEDKHLGNLPIVRKVLLEQQRQRIEAEEETRDQTGCKLENRIRHTYVRSAHLKRLLSGRFAHLKRRKPGIKYVKNLSLEELTGLGNGVESEDSLETHSEPLPERQLSPLVHLKKIKSCVDSNESELDERSQMSSISDTQPSKNSGVREEIINCTCGSQEEHGLMVQCDICLCWQHGSCNNIQEEVDVPEKYVCTFCLNPPLERPSKKYSHSQEWLLSGKLPRLSVASSDEQEKEECAEMLKTSHDVMAALVNLKKAVWATRVKVEALCCRDHPKLYHWSEKWDTNTENLNDDDNDNDDNEKNDNEKNDNEKNDNEKNDNTLVNGDDNVIDVRSVQSIKEETMTNDDAKTDPVKKEENVQDSDEVEIPNVFLTLSSSSSTESVNSLPPTFETVADLPTEDRCVPHESDIIEEAVTEFAVPVPEDGNSDQDSLSTDASFLTTENSFNSQELSFTTPDTSSIHESAKSPMEDKKVVIERDYEIISQTMQDFLAQQQPDQEEDDDDGDDDDDSSGDDDDDGGDDYDDDDDDDGGDGGGGDDEDDDEDDDDIYDDDDDEDDEGEDDEEEEEEEEEDDDEDEEEDIEEDIEEDGDEEEEDVEEEEEESLSNEEESESMVQKSFCQTLDDDKRDSEVYSQSPETHKVYREENSISEDLNGIDEDKIHDERSATKETDDEKCTAVIINLNTGSNDSLQETEANSSSCDRDEEMVHNKIGMSIKSEVDDCSTLQQALSTEHGMRVRTIKTDPKITVQLVENVPGISLETELNKSIVLLQAGDDKPPLQKTWDDFDVAVESDKNEFDAAFHTGQNESEKVKCDETVKSVRNKADILFHSSKSRINVTAKQIKDEPISSEVCSSTPLGNRSISPDITGITKSVNVQIPQIKLETTVTVVENPNDRTVDVFKVEVQCEDSSSGEGYDNIEKATNRGSESQCRERDSFTSISTNLSTQTEGGNENGGDAGNDSPDSFDRILNALKTRSESVSCQENLSSDPDFESEVAMLEETVHSIESDSCGPSGMEQIRNTSNPLESLPISVFPRENSHSVNDDSTVQYEAFMDNANDAVVPNILNQSGEQHIKITNHVNISAAPVIFEDLLLRDVESVHGRGRSSEATDSHLPINATQILQLADNMEESLCSTDSENHRRVPATGPQPEVLIETEVCQNNLADHIAEEQKKLMKVLDAAEDQIKELESKCMDDSEEIKPLDVKRRMKRIVKILNLVNNLSKRDNVQAAKSVSNSK